MLNPKNNEKTQKNGKKLAFALLMSGLGARPLWAATEAQVSAGDTAWVLLSTLLVFLMTPGLALFYGGMVQTRNVLSTLLQSFVCLGIVAVIWMVGGYSLVFSGDFAGLLGNLNWAFLNGVGQAPNADYAATIPHQNFMLFQCMFAVITPALISGALAERMRFKAWAFFVLAWTLVVYLPVAHWVWGVGGWIRELGALDFAGGLVVHMTAGFSGLAAALFLGRRREFGKPGIRPHDPSMTLIGAALLWFGWFGFNAGSALGANGLAAHACVTTFLGGVGALLGWGAVELARTGKVTAMGVATGSVVGLVAITPAAGFVSPAAALLTGGAAGVICPLAVQWVKETLKIDDALDVFGCHGVAGLIGTLATGLFASKAINPSGADGVLLGNPALMKAQLLAAGGVIFFSVAATWGVLRVIRFFMPLQVGLKDEAVGLDLTQHGETLEEPAPAPTFDPLPALLFRPEESFGHAPFPGNFRSSEVWNSRSDPSQSPSPALWS